MKLRTFFLSAVLLFVSTNSFSQEVQKVNFITNKDKITKRMVKGITETPFETNVYDISLFAYDKKFAEEFGLRDEFVETLDKGLRFIEVKMLTEANQTNCYYNVILDKDVEIAFPKDQNFFFKNNPDLYGFLGKKLPDDEKSFEYQIADRKFKLSWKMFFTHRSADYDKYYSNRLYIGTKDYKENKKVRAKNGSSLMYYIQDRFDYQILSIKSLSCFFDANIIAYDKPSVWIAKRSDIKYNILVGVDPDYFHKFSIPHSISKKFAPILKQYKDGEVEIQNKYYRTKLNKQN